MIVIITSETKSVRVKVHKHCHLHACLMQKVKKGKAIPVTGRGGP
jgi:hypothetical protein